MGIHVNAGDIAPGLPEVNRKRIICSLLGMALQYTRQCWDLVALQYDPGKEMVTAYFTHGKKIVNVAGDSEIAMIKDVVKALGG